MFRANESRIARSMRLRSGAWGAMVTRLSNTLDLGAVLLAQLLACAACGGTKSAVEPDASEHFSLLYRDDFEQLDLSRWQLMTHSWNTNLALFSANAVAT